MKYIIKRYNRNSTAEEMIEDLATVARVLNVNALSQTDYRPKGKYHPATIARKFGGWNNALLKAGLKFKKNHLLTESELLNNLRKVWDSLGRQPNIEEMKKPLSEYCANAYTRRWGSWLKSLEAFVEYMRVVESKGEAEAEGKLNSKFRKKKTSRNINSRLRLLILQRDLFKCKICGASPSSSADVKLEVDHIIPYSKGGETVESNLQTLCRLCNNGKSNYI